MLGAGQGLRSLLGGQMDPSKKCTNEAYVWGWDFVEQLSESERADSPGPWRCQAAP